MATPTRTGSGQRATLAAERADRSTARTLADVSVPLAPRARDGLARSSGVRTILIMVAVTVGVLGALALGPAVATPARITPGADPSSISAPPVTLPGEHATSPSELPSVRALLPLWGPVPTAFLSAASVAFALVLVLSAGGHGSTPRQRRWRAQLIGAPPGSVTPAIP